VEFYFKIVAKLQLPCNKKTNRQANTLILLPIENNTQKRHKICFSVRKINEQAGSAACFAQTRINGGWKDDESNQCG
jgi:hypothetical protein